MMYTQSKQESQKLITALWEELLRGQEAPYDLAMIHQSLVKHAVKNNLKAVFKLEGRVLQVSVFFEGGGSSPNDIHSFTLELPSRLSGTKSEAEREVNARRGASRQLIDGIVDGLEFRFRADRVRKQFGELGGKDGPVDIFYDLVDVGARALRELLDLNARANRRLLGALQSLDTNSSSLVVVRAGTGAVLRLYGDESSTVTLENQRSGELRVTLPNRVSVCKPDGTGARYLDLKVEPAEVLLGRGECCVVSISLTKKIGGEELMGELVISGPEGGIARVAVVVCGGKESGA